MTLHTGESMGERIGKERAEGSAHVYLAGAVLLDHLCNCEASHSFRSHGRTTSGNVYLLEAFRHLRREGILDYDADSYAPVFKEGVTQNNIPKEYILTVPAEATTIWGQLDLLPGPLAGEAA